MTPTRALLALLMIVLVLARPKPAWADEVAPDLEGADLRTRAQSELRTLVSGMSPSDQKRLIGVYAAFDTNAGDPFAQVSCDDDGDYVILISDAMLRLAAHVARASSYEDKNRKIEEFAAFVARSQIPGRRLLVPPRDFYDAAAPPGAYEERLRETLSFIVARELAHLRAGDLVCPKPTATKESGDEMWTSAEQRNAAEIALRVYPGLQVERDTEATDRLLRAGHGEKGALSLLRFFAHFELESGSAGARFHPTYAMQHPNAATREAVVKQTVLEHRL